MTFVISSLLIYLFCVQAVDVGGSMFVHVFGAYFGLAVARVLSRDATKDNNKEGASYHSDIFSLIGQLSLYFLT